MRDDIFALLHLIEKNMQSTHNYSAKGDFCTVGDVAVIFSPTCRCSKNTVMYPVSLFHIPLLQDFSRVL